MRSKILVTGGTGYIGSHTAVKLIENGLEPLILDNLCNSSISVLRQIQKITGKKPLFIKGDINDGVLLRSIFEEYHIHSVIHFAGLKAVGESVENPLDYYNSNIKGTLNLLNSMRNAGVKNLVFSSSATVYGVPEHVPLKEDASISAINPYGQTKVIAETVLKDLSFADPLWNITILRYFNPVGAHKSGLIGEKPNGKPNNLLPFIAQTAVGMHEYVSVFGDDYPTPDGTGIRDYIHIDDLAEGHIAALNHMQKRNGLHIYNLGTGRGYSVLEIIQAFEKASNRRIPYQIKPRRLGDVAEYWADPSRIYDTMGWKASRNLEEICEDAWRWQIKGFSDITE